MKIDYRNQNVRTGRITKLFEFLETRDSKQQWVHMGMLVELDCTVDFENQNILVRWIDMNEGFNDRIIVHSKEVFLSHFKISNND